MTRPWSVSLRSRTGFPTHRMKATSALASMTRAILSPLYSRPGKTGCRGLDSVQKRESRQSAASSPCGSCALLVSSCEGCLRSNAHRSISRFTEEQRKLVSRKQQDEWIDLQFCERNSENKEPSRRSVSIATFSPEVGAGHCFCLSRTSFRVLMTETRSRI